MSWTPRDPTGRGEYKNQWKQTQEAGERDKKERKSRVDEKKPKKERERERGGEMSLFSRWPPSSSPPPSTPPSPLGSQVAKAGHRRPSFPSPCWPCWPFQTRSSSSGRTSARRGTKKGSTSERLKASTLAPSTQCTRRTEYSLASSRRFYTKKAKQVLTKWQASNCEAFHMTNEPSD